MKKGSEKDKLYAILWDEQQQTITYFQLLDDTIRPIDRYINYSIQNSLKWWSFVFKQN